MYFVAPFKVIAIVLLKAIHMIAEVNYCTSVSAVAAVDVVKM